MWEKVLEDTCYIEGWSNDGQVFKWYIKGVYVFMERKHMWQNYLYKGTQRDIDVHWFNFSYLWNSLKFMGRATARGSLHIKLSEASEYSMHWPKLSHIILKKRGCLKLVSPNCWIYKKFWNEPFTDHMVWI